jgi:hypothetical protein
LDDLPLQNQLSDGFFGSPAFRVHLHISVTGKMVGSFGIKTPCFASSTTDSRQYCIIAGFIIGYLKHVLLQ